MNIHELAAETGLAERQVRFLVAEGIIPPPTGGRANADYGAAHVDGIVRYQRLKALGFPPAAIKLLLQASEGVPLVIAPGVTLVIDPKLVGSGADTAPLLEKIASALKDAVKGGTHVA